METFTEGVSIPHFGGVGEGGCFLKLEGYFSHTCMQELVC